MSESLSKIHETCPDCWVPSGEQHVKGCPQIERSLSKFRDVVPFEPGKRHVPAYYRPARRNPRIDPSADVSDVLHAWAVDDHALGEAVAKILRLGRKPGEPRVRELTKVLEHVTRALEYAELEVRDRCEAEARDARSTSVPVDDPLAGYSETVRRAKGGA